MNLESSFCFKSLKDGGLPLNSKKQVLHKLSLETLPMKQFKHEFADS